MTSMKRFIPLLVTVLLFLAIFIPRYYGHLLYDAMEDEILAISNNLSYSPFELIFAPDFTHPGLWYVLMELPTNILGISHGIFYYRLVQVVIYFILSLFSVWFFWNRLPKQLLIIFHALVLSNVYIIHVTFQHRMYGLVLGISLFFSLYWLKILIEKENNKLLVARFSLLGLISSLGFFSNYSFIWLIPVWPLAFLLSKRSVLSIKQIAIFCFTQLILCGWFIKIFIINAQASVTHNQWASDLTKINVLQLIGNYFGLIPKHEVLNKVNPLLAVVLIIFLGTVFNLFFIKKLRLVGPIFLGIVTAFLFYIVAVYFTKNSLLYARTSIPIVIACYVLLSWVFYRGSKLVKVAVVGIILVQLSQFVLYYQPTADASVEYQFFNYHQHPVKYFQNYTFSTESCVITLPSWNHLATEFFLSEKVKVISIYELDDETFKTTFKDCNNLYLLDQVSVDRKEVEKEINLIKNEHYENEFIQRNENIELFKLVSAR